MSYRPKTITYFIETNSFGGSEKHLLELIENLNDIQFERHLILHAHNCYPLNIEFIEEKIRELLNNGKIKTYHRFETNSVSLSELTELKKMIELWKLISKSKGIVHFYKNSIESCSKAIFMAWLQRKTTIQTIQLGPGWHSQKCISRPEIRRTIYLKLATKVISVSESIRAECIKFYKTQPEKIITIHNGISIEKSTQWSILRIEARKMFEQEFGVSLINKFILIAPSRLEPIKGHDKLLLALSHLKNYDSAVYNSLQLWCAGDGTMRKQLEQRVKELEIYSCVKFLGFRKDVPLLIRAADAFIITSLNEGLPLAVIEAMLLETPVIATAVDGTPEAVEHGRTGILVSQNTPDMITEAIKKIINLSETDRLEMGKRARDKCINEFDNKKLIQRVENIYMELSKEIN